MRDGDGDGDDGGGDGDGDGGGKLYGDGDAACRVCDARAQDAFAVPLLPPSFSFIFVAAAAAAAACCFLRQCQRSQSIAFFGRHLNCVTCDV